MGKSNPTKQKPSKNQQVITELASNRFFLLNIAKELIAQSEAVEKTNEDIMYACLSLVDYAKDLRTYAGEIGKVENVLKSEVGKK